MDACDDVPKVAFVVVMIKSELDERGYPFQATEFREYIASRLVRNGRTAAVTEPQDFASIIRRRLFEQQHKTLPTKALASASPKRSTSSGKTACSTGSVPSAGPLALPIVSRPSTHSTRS